MAGLVEIRVPDLGDFKDVEVIDVPVKAGDAIAEEASLITLETEKATMDVPSPAGGTIKELKIKRGDRVSKGDLIALLESAQPEAPAAAATAAAPASPASAPAEQAPAQRSHGDARARRGARRRAQPGARARSNEPACQPRRRAAARHRRARLFTRARESIGPAFCARARCGSRAHHGHRFQGPDHARRREGLRQAAP